MNVRDILSRCEFYTSYIRVLHKNAKLNVREIAEGTKTRNFLDAKLKGFTVSISPLHAW